MRSCMYTHTNQPGRVRTHAHTHTRTNQPGLLHHSPGLSHEHVYLHEQMLFLNLLLSFLGTNVALVAEPLVHRA